MGFPIDLLLFNRQLHVDSFLCVYSLLYYVCLLGIDWYQILVCTQLFISSFTFIDCVFIKHYM